MVAHATLRKCPRLLVRAIRTVCAFLEAMDCLRPLSLSAVTLALTVVAYAGCGGAVTPDPTGTSGAQTPTPAPSTMPAPTSAPTTPPSAGGVPQASGSSSSTTTASSGSVTSAGSTASAGGSGFYSVPAMPTPVTPPPPACNFALPSICELCSNGETECAHYAIQNGQCVTEICPPTSPPPVPIPTPTPYGCTQGASCEQNTACGGGPTTNSGCTTSCFCDPTGHLQCSASCPPPVVVPPCAEPGDVCTPGSGCGTAAPPGVNVCGTTCNCDATGHMQCSNTCSYYVDASVPPPVPIDPCAGIALPHSCLICPNGQMTCAHFVIVNGQCEVQICQ
jgi:hypothetical protein